MINRQWKSLFVIASLGVFACGCAEQKKPEVISSAPPVASSNRHPDVAEKPDEKENKSESPALALTETKDEPDAAAIPEEKPAVTKGDAGPAATKVEVKPRQDVRPFLEGAFLPDEIVGLMTVHPRQFVGSPLGKLLIELGVEQESGELAEMLKRLHLKLNHIDRLTVAIEQSQINTFASQIGLPVERMNVAQPGPARFNLLKNSLKQIGLAFHNYHDTFQKFPRADGDGAGQKTGLSWRVYLLPYLDQAPLYNRFHFDEAWDSEHNKSLIAEMPALFQSPGVTEEGKTAFHVFTGEKTMFHGDEGVGIRSVTDGTSNTILAVIAAAETAEIWTKPGGLEVDLSEPKKSLGDTKDEPVLALIADGSVREIPADINDTLLANLIQPADGNVVEFGGHGSETIGAPHQPAILLPPTILTLNQDAQQEDLVKGLLGEAVIEIHEGQSVFNNKTSSVWFPDKQTVIAGPLEFVKKMISTKLAGKVSSSPLIEQLDLAADLSVAIDMESQAALLRFVAQLNPMLGMISNIKTLAAEFSTSGKEGDSLVEINVTALDTAMANALSAIATLGLNQAKMTIEQIPEAPHANASDKEMQKLIKQTVASALVTQKDDKIQLRVPTPSGFDRVPVLLKPTLLEAKAAARLTQQKNTLKMIGLAFHNYHDVYAAFPGAGRARAEGPVGLSWRVHLLPFLDQAPLYTQFKLDEPWDSEHNKELIEKMPPLFKSPGADEPGKTSFHVFTGPRSPFEDDAAPKIQQFTDGTSNTFLAVQAGPNTAEIWTKPGGLDFAPEDPVKGLGNIIGESFLVLFADGSVRSVSKQIDSQLLRKLIQYNDGEAVPNF